MMHNQEANVWVMHSREEMGYGEIISTYTMYVGKVNILTPGSLNCTASAGQGMRSTVTDVQSQSLLGLCLDLHTQVHLCIEMPCKVNQRLPVGENNSLLEEDVFVTLAQSCSAVFNAGSPAHSV